MIFDFQVFELFLLLDFLKFLNLFGISFIFLCFLGFLSKLLRLQLKVTKVTTGHQKLPIMGQNSIISSFFCPKVKKSLGCRPKPSAGARSRPPQLTVSSSILQIIEVSQNIPIYAYSVNNTCLQWDIHYDISKDTCFIVYILRHWSLSIFSGTSSTWKYALVQNCPQQLHRAPRLHEPCRAS